MITNENFQGYNLLSTKADFTAYTHGKKGTSKLSILPDIDLYLEQIANDKGEHCGNEFKATLSASLIGMRDEIQTFSLIASFCLTFDLGKDADLTQDDVDKSQEIIYSKASESAEDIFKLILSMTSIKHRMIG